MPALTEFWDTHQSQRDEFEILGVHYANPSRYPEMKTAEQVLAQLQSRKIIENRWNGRSLPFPSIVDGNASIKESLNVTGYPTALLVSPEGQLIHASHFDAHHLLHAVLALPAAEREKLDGAAQLEAAKRSMDKTSQLIMASLDELDLARAVSAAKEQSGEDASDSKEPQEKEENADSDATAKKKAVPAVPLVGKDGKAPEKKVITGKVLGADGEALAGIEVSTSWNSYSGAPAPSRAQKTDEEGIFKDLSFYRTPVVAAAYSEDRKLAGLAGVGKESSREVEIKLAPVATLTASLVAEEGAPEWAVEYVKSGRFSFMVKPNEGAGKGHYFFRTFASKGKVECTLPAGEMGYWLLGGKDYLNQTGSVSLKPGETTDLGTITIRLSNIAKAYGKQAPALTITGARGVSTDMKLTDYKGKWVLLEFWGFW